jgi:hypothetical protein
MTKWSEADLAREWSWTLQQVAAAGRLGLIEPSIRIVDRNGIARRVERVRDAAACREWLEVFRALAPQHMRRALSVRYGRRMAVASLLGELGWSSAQLMRARQSLRFPPATSMKAVESDRVRIEPAVWCHEVDEWLEAVSVVLGGAANVPAPAA